MNTTDNAFNKSLEATLKVLKKHGVEYFKHGELELKIGNSANLNTFQNAKEASKSNDKITEDDLFYSSSPIKKVK